MIRVNSRVRLNMTRIRELTGAQVIALEQTAEALHAEIVQSQVVPFQTGNLQNESMFVDDRLFRKPFRARRTDIVGVEHFEHVRSGIAHPSADREDDRHRDGQNHVVQNVPELAHHSRKRSGIILRRREQTAYGQPAQIDGE